MILLQNQSPFFVFHGYHLTYNYLHSFDCVCYIHIRHKFQDRAIQCKFFGYLDEYKGFRCHDPTTRKVHMSRNVIFDDENFRVQDIGECETKEVYDSQLRVSLLYDTCIDTSNEDTFIYSSLQVDNASNEQPTEPPPSESIPSTQFSGLIYHRRTVATNHDTSLRRSERICHPINHWVSCKNFSEFSVIFYRSI